MTAEIAILNRTAVALAADSAVTIGDSKVYNSVNKLFALSKHHPIGIMIYGNADYMNIPWETVIKLYRDELGSKSFPTVEQYAQDFVRYLERGFTINLDDEGQRIGQLWSAYFEDLNLRVRQELLDRASSKPLTQDEVSAIFLAVLKEDIATLRSLKTFGKYSKVKPSSVPQRFKAQFEGVRDHYFRGRPFTPAITRALKEFAGLVIVKEEFTRGISGLVIAGFGDDEIFPSMSRMLCAGRILGHLKIHAADTYNITSEAKRSVCIAPFAQGEMVYRFMEGIDEEYSEYITDGVEQLMYRLAADLIVKYSTGSSAVKIRRAKAVQKTIGKMIGEFERLAKQTRRRYFVEPITNVVSILPKDELAQLAEALVNITSLKRKISLDAETVGGPIDVAVISKGDGFIWIKRKHYFLPQLNPTFVPRYMSTSQEG